MIAASFIGSQLASVLSGGVAPLIATALLAADGWQEKTVDTR